MSVSETPDFDGETNGDVEMQEPHAQPQASRDVTAPGPGSDRGQPLEAGSQTSRSRLLIAGSVAAVTMLALIVGLAVGLTAVKCEPWCQPAEPRRAFNFERFTSCAHMQEVFMAKAKSETSLGVLSGTDAQVRPVSGTFYARYSSDYCEYCNCTTGGPSFFPEEPWLVSADLSATALSAESASPKAAAGGASSSETVAADFTGTNNQVEGVDEADVVKTDGTYLYVLPRAGDILVVSRVFPTSAARVLSRVNLTRYNLRASDALLDTASNTLAVLGASAVKNDASTMRLSMAAIHLFDITNKSAPELKTVYEIEGRSLTARFIDGHVYAVVSTWPSYAGTMGVGSGASGAPKMSSSSAASSPASSSSQSLSLRTLAPLARKLTPAQADVEKRASAAVAPVCACSDMTFVSNLGRPSGWITIVAVSTSRSSLGRVKTVTHAGRGQTIMASSNRLYVSGTNWDYSMSERDRPGDGQWTVVLQFALGNGSPSFERLLTVRGSILNQFALDEYRGHLRVATTFGRMWGSPPTSQSNVYVLRVADGAQAGAVEGLAPGERIYSVRFLGPKAYVVTFRQVDPLFALDLSDPTAPRVRGELKIPGFSEYLHPVSDSLLLGLGSETLTNADGRTVTRGVKLSLFDVSVPERPTELHFVIVGQRGSYSIAAKEPKAFLFHAASGLLVVPMHVRRLSAAQEASLSAGDALFWAYGEDVDFEGAYVYYIKEGRIALDHTVSHGRHPLRKGWYGMQGEREIYRSVYMDGHLLTVSDREVQIEHLANKVTLGSLNVTKPHCHPSGQSAGSVLPEPEPVF